MQNTTKCNACEKDFTLEAKDIRNRQSGDLLFQYFKCPNCDAAFLISVSDKEFRKYLKRLKKPLKAEAYAPIREALNRKYFPRFKELFPKAYEACDEGAQETPQAE